MSLDSVLDITAQGAWNGGTLVDNSIFEKKGLEFKGGIPVNDETIQQRIGVRTRMAASADERIGVKAMQDLIDTSGIDLSRIKLIIAATNVGEDKYDPGPLIKYPFDLVREHCPDAMALDVYAGCPGFNTSMELAFVLSLTGGLNEGDISIIVGAENIHRANAFPPNDTGNIIFGDDALATALETKASLKANGRYSVSEKHKHKLKEDFVTDTARLIYEAYGNEKIGGIIIDNQMGVMEHRIPAVAARIQASLVEQMYPEEASKGTFKRFREALEFYDSNVTSFAYDINTDGGDRSLVDKFAKAFVESGKYGTILAGYLTSDLTVEFSLHKGEGFNFVPPRSGIIDSHTSTHGCFGDYIEVMHAEGDIWGDMNGKGVFLYATRGAKPHIDKLLSRNNLTMKDIDLLIEHQANFAMLPMTLEKVLNNGQPDVKKDVIDYLANKMVTNIHRRGNCSVVCMQRLPYDLQRGALEEDTIQGFPVNRNLEQLRNAKIILYDSVGAGMTRSSVLRKK
ncbi:MAG: hypothetical protein JRG97_03690 [Deltaproteobacteria bacterium]|nr:hypothetical protein [Deltaproteobacteria bacterium]MBW2051601.1 hypothetical protein [Deltaproteobacteria bacterium]MBW2140158.1 hypothetical protein [Deltaproteobacteria bacterium]MBW2322923.1 hypothetical protein [Deltaproteobacteria bacterium]